MTPDDQIARLHSILRRDGPGRRRVREVGCGSLPMALDLGEDAHIVGIDISEEQLRRNDAVHENVAHRRTALLSRLDQPARGA